MISQLNFKELLIHNPVDLINFSKSEISVALSQEQYIDFFSNKGTYIGLYFDENMGFCVLFYADPLQSYKSGEMYAQGYIDVNMKIYRVKVLSEPTIRYGSKGAFSWGVTKTGMRISTIAENVTLVMAGALTKIDKTNNVSGWTDGTLNININDGDILIDGYGMRGLRNG